MFKFRRQRKDRALGVARGAWQPLDAVPLPAEGVSARLDDQSLVQLNKRGTPRPGLYRLAARLFRYRYNVRVNLDERGSYFWQLMDGRRSLQQIADGLARKCSLDAEQSREAVMLFTEALMLRRLICLQTPES